MKIGLIIFVATGVVLTSLLFLWRNDPYLPPEKDVLAAARSIEMFVELEERDGPFKLNIGSAVMMRHTGHHGSAEIIGVHEGSIFWSYYPANGDVIIRRITADGHTLYEEDREQDTGGNAI